MKKTFTSLAIALIASNAHAVPTGCFVTDGTNFCYAGSFLASDCDQWNMTPFNFGNYVASMCSYVNSTENLFSVCDTTLKSCDSAFNAALARQSACVADKNTCEAMAAGIERNRQEWIAYANGRNLLLKKLYKACGSKCRRIK
jgi:hypothetical protein